MIYPTVLPVKLSQNWHIPPNFKSISVVTLIHAEGLRSSTFKQIVKDALNNGKDEILTGNTV